MSVSVPLPPPPPPQFDEEDLLSLKEQDPYAATGPDLLSNNGIPSKYLEKGVRGFISMVVFFLWFIH